MLGTIHKINMEMRFLARYNFNELNFNRKRLCSSIFSTFLWGCERLGCQRTGFRCGSVLQLYFSTATIGRLKKCPRVYYSLRFTIKVILAFSNESRHIININMGNARMTHIVNGWSISFLWISGLAGPRCLTWLMLDNCGWADSTQPIPKCTVLTKLQITHLVCHLILHKERSKLEVQQWKPCLDILSHYSLHTIRSVWCDLHLHTPCSNKLHSISDLLTSISFYQM